MSNEETFVCSFPLSGANAAKTAIPGAAALVLAGLGAWLTRDDPPPVRISSAIFLVFFAAVGFALLALGAWMHLRRAVWVLRANASEISLTTEDSRGRVRARQRVEVRDLCEIRWVESDADISPGFLLRTADRNEFTIPAEVLDVSAFISFARKQYPGVLAD